MIKRTETESKKRRSNRDATRSHRAGVRTKRRMMMENLEPRQLLAGGGVTNIPVVNVPTFTGARNIGTVQSTPFVESELNDVSGGNDTLFSADVVPLGTGSGQSDTIDLTGSVSFQIRNPAVVLQDGTIIPATFDADIDTYAVDLKAGDILDIATLGAVSNFTVLFENGRIWWGTDNNQAPQSYPPNSPLQTLGNAVYSQVVPEDGRYYITVAPDSIAGQYTMGLRVYRPVVESLPIASQQVIFLDLDGTVLPASVLDDGTGVPQGGVIRYPGLQESLNFIGVDPLDVTAYDRFLDLTLAEMESHFDFLGVNGNAGDFDRTGVPGDFGVTILNSRDHADPGNNPLVTRVYVGGASAVIGGNLGISTTVDVGNFSMDDIVFATLEGHLIDNAVLPLSNTISPLESTAWNLAFTISHEVAHSFGMRHTDASNNVGSLIDEGGNIASDLGVGFDGILGTLDDVEVNFVDDNFSLAEGLFGVNRVTNSLANTLVTGTVGGSIAGRAFNDINRDGVGTNDSGLAGVTVFADLNGNGIADPSEPTDITGADGSFVLSSAGGSANIIAVVPEQFAASTATTVAASFVLGSSTAGVEFGFTQVVADITGTKFADLDNDGFFDPTEPGLDGVYIYLDLDGDNRPDLGEPAALTGSDGSYAINFPGPGTYTIREVVAPGFVQTFPATGEHTVVFNGTALTDNYNFGNLPSRDFGDAPDSYGTLEASNGPSHGLTSGLSLGSIGPDRELNGQPSINALGDDSNGAVGLNGVVVDDEDGIALLGPLGPGASADLSVTLNNNTGSPAYLQAWFDFNVDGDFTDPGEQVATDMEVGTGSFILPVNVPANATIGTTYARFRYSQTSGLGPNGAADTGEVEDYAFPILAAAQIANNDEVTVSRNSLSNQIDILANDFQTTDNQLQIINLNRTGTVGEAVIASDGGSVFYTPRNGFIGRDQFGYTVQDAFGRQSTAIVTVNVTFQTTSPIALDDTFNVAQGSTNRALNVLDNDVPSIAGGSSITSVTPGSQGGTIAITGGGQSLRYSPLPGFNGTEQFTYSIQDAVGATSSAIVTVNLLPGSRSDDEIGYTIQILDSVNQQPIDNVQVGDTFDVRVSVDDLRLAATDEGVASAFLDLLYTDELVAVLNTGANSALEFDISFGELFSTIQGGNVDVPGVINEVGGVQTTIPNQSHSGPVELFTVRMQAVSPGVAIFQGDPADSDFGESVLVSEEEALPVERLRFESQELVIFPASDNFSSAIDDSFPDGRDSSGNIIGSTAGGQALAARLDVLTNDNLGPTGQITEFGLVTAAGIGNALVNDNGTPTNLNDDYIEYFADAGASGFDQFSYLIVTADGVRSVGNVTMAIGNAGADDIAAIDFALVNEAGASINSVSVGDRFGVQVIVEDLRTSPEFVFSAFLDMMYSSNLAPTNIVLGGNLDFDVDFGPNFNADTGVGTSIRDGLLDEFGAVLVRQIAQDEVGANPGLMATVFFEAIAGGQASVVGGPADNLDFQETTLFNLGNPVPVSQIRYDVLDITITGQGDGIRQNAANRLDVDANGIVSPLDALLGINAFADGQDSSRAAAGESSLHSDLYLDVSGDGRFTALDIVQIINHLSDEAGALGESVVSDTLENPTKEDSSAPASDSVFAATDNSKLIAGVAEDSTQLAPAIEIANADTADDDEADDVLRLLADDIAGLNG